MTGPSGSVFGPQFAKHDVDTFDPIAGVYTLKVNGSAPADKGTHSFRMWTVVDQTGAITLGTPKAATLTVPGQRAVFTFSGALNQRITVALSGSTDRLRFVAFVAAGWQHAESGWLWYG